MNMPEWKFGDEFGKRREPDDSYNPIPKHIQDKLDEADRVIKEMDLTFNPEKKTEKYPSWKDDSYVYRTTTEKPSWDWHPMTERTETFLSDYNKKWDHHDDLFKNTQMEISHHRYTPLYMWVPFVCLLPVVIILLVFLAIYLARRKNKWTSSAAVLPNGRVIGPGPGPVQQNQQMTPMIPPGQGGAVPPSVPYSDNFNRPYNDEPPAYPTDADLQVNNSGVGGIGFRNEVAPVPSAPPPYSDNSEPVESLNFGLNKEKVGQGTRNADEKETVKYVDEKSVHKE